jgi:hypothetical protein
VDEETIGDGKPGAHTRTLMQAFEEYTTRLATATA